MIFISLSVPTTYHTCDGIFVIDKLGNYTATAALLQITIWRFELPDFNGRIYAAFPCGYVATAAGEGNGCECFAGGIDQIGLCVTFGIEEDHCAAAEREREMKNNKFTVGHRRVALLACGPRITHTLRRSGNVVKVARKLI